MPKKKPAPRKKPKKAAAPEPNPVGRPPKYDPSYCKRILDLMSAPHGLTLTAAAAECDIHRDTAYDWEGKYPDFSDAVKLGRAKRTLFLERGLNKAVDGPVVTKHIFALKNAAPQEWREKIEVQRTMPDLSGLSKDDLDLIDAIAARAARFGSGSGQA